jgi:hypothetical protein
MVIIVEDAQSLAEEKQGVVFRILRFVFDGAAQNADSRLEKLDVLFFFGQPFFVDGIALDQVILEALGRPLAELGAALRFDAVADRDDYIKIVIVDFSRYFSFTFGLTVKYFLTVAGSSSSPSR